VHKHMEMRAHHPMLVPRCPRAVLALLCLGTLQGLLVRLGSAEWAASECVAASFRRDVATLSALHAALPAPAVPAAGAAAQQPDGRAPARSLCACVERPKINK